ncbi:BPI fold-containing family B member 6 [Pogona vitticeps]
MAVRIEDMFVVNEIGDHGTMQYELDGVPDLDGEWIGLCLRPIFYDKDGKEKEISNEPPLSDDLPEKKEGSNEIILPVNILNALMELFTDDFSCEVTGADSPLLTVNKLAEILPSIKDTLPPSGKVKVEIRPEEPPKFSLAEGKSSLVIFPKVDILIHDTGRSILSFQMTHEWLTKFAVDDEKLKIEVYEVRTSDARDFSPSVDEADVEALKGYMEDIVSGVCLPNVNKIMADNKMALPNMMGATYSECETSITSVKDALAFDVTPKDLPMDLVALADKFSHIQKKHHY